MKLQRYLTLSPKTKETISKVITETSVCLCGSFSEAGPLLTANLVRLHKNAGHASLTDMRNCLQCAKLWTEKEHADALKEIIREWPCEKKTSAKTYNSTKIIVNHGHQGPGTLYRCCIFWRAPKLTCRGQVLRPLCLRQFKQQVNFDTNSCFEKDLDR